MGKIQVLPPQLVNRIAAGECVERPASVVKELVENALDAGATRIDITILDGGRELIQVADDGCGMDADDLRHCVEPHATSKLRSDDDLFNIRTLGFRGEALPSIGAVARLAITSRPAADQVAHVIRVDAGAISGPTPCGGPPGTTVEVRDLFYCVPARRKFLRTSQTEMSQISEQLARLALAQPGVAFALRHNTRAVTTLPAVGDRRRRIGDFFGPELAEVLLPVRREGGGVAVEGLVAPPAESRGSGKWEYVFVNGRFVRDRFIGHAIREAYRSLIDPSRFPVTFLFLTVDPESVDVNVHPTKIEVRWRDSNFVHGQVLAALRDKFLSSRLDATLRTPASDEAYRQRVRSAMVDYFMGRGGEGPRGQGAEGTRGEGAEGPRGRGFEGVVGRGDEGGRGAGRAAQGEWSPVADGAESQISNLKSQISDVGVGFPDRRPGDSPAATGLAAIAPDNARDGGDPIAHASRYAASASDARSGAAGVDVHSTAGADAVAQSLAPLRPAVQIHRSYLVVETDDGLMIVDQHALHERILYEELRKRMLSRHLESQRLLLPEVVRVPPDRIAALETHADALARLGIELSASGPHSVTLHAFPSLLERVERVAFVRDLLDLLAQAGARPEPDTLLHELLDMMACKAAVKAGDPLTPDEIAALLARRELAERSSNCPHGRPTTLRLTLRDLERQFKRR